MTYSESHTEISTYEVATQMVRIGLMILLVEVEIVESAVHLDFSCAYDVGACGLEERILVGRLRRGGIGLSREVECKEGCN